MARPRAWADKVLESSLAEDGILQVDLLENAPTSDTLTVARIILDIEVALTSTNENECTQTLDLVIGVASVEAFAVASSAGLPQPDVATAYPPRGWLYASRRILQQALPTGGTPTAMYRTNAVFREDIHGMRKIDKGILFMLIKNDNADGTGQTVQIYGRTRALCLT